MCNKRTYRSRLQALGVAAKMSGKSGDPLRVYPCSKCHGFHLTKTKTRGKRATQ